MHVYDDRELAGGATTKAVWIVDDDRSIRWVLEKALEREGIPFKTFASVIEVMQALQHSQPQVLVSDIRMPGESGLALLGKIKERHPRVPVIIMLCRFKARNPFSTLATFSEASDRSQSWRACV